jgi:hypothetical protein
MEIVMKKLSAALIGALVLSTLVSSAATPAFALGACGPNGHRNVYGRCVFGGQNQAWCLRHTGHMATYVGRGVYRCF